MHFGLSVVHSDVGWFCSHFSTGRFTFAFICNVAVFVAVIALLELVLRHVHFWHVEPSSNEESILNASVCFLNRAELNYNRLSWCLWIALALA